MGIFRQFPYTNFHEMNLDWMLNQLRGIDEKLDEALDLIKNKIDTLFDDEKVKEKIDQLIEEYLTPEEIDTIVTGIIETLTNTRLDPLEEEINTNFKDLEENINDRPFGDPIPNYLPLSNTKLKLRRDPNRYVPQGSCCDGTYYYVYTPNYYGGGGIIDKYNMNNIKYARTDFPNDPESAISEIGTNRWTLENSANINLEHGNDMVYRKDTNEIYVCAYVTDSGSPETGRIQTPNNNIFVVDPETLAIKRTLNVGKSLLGIGFNDKTKTWVGWEIIYGNANYNHLIFWNEDFSEVISDTAITLLPCTRSAIFANDEYIFLILSRNGNRGFADNPTATSFRSNGGTTDCSLITYDWNLRFRGEASMHNACELEGICYTGQGHVATFYDHKDDVNGISTTSYVTFFQLYPNEPMSYSWYKRHWGQNQTAWYAIDEEHLQPITLNAVMRGLDTKVPFTATHLELLFCTTFSSNIKSVTIPRAYGQYNLSQWITLTQVSSNYTVIESIRLDQKRWGIVYGSFNSITINHSDGSVTRNNAPVHKLKQVRAVNYTMQPRYNPYETI